MDQQLRLLFIEDRATDFELTTHTLKHEGLNFLAHRVETREEFAAELDSATPDVIISDYFLPDFDCLQALEITRSKDPLLPFIVLTGSINEETAVRCLKAGATDYVLKEHLYRLRFAIQESLKYRQNQLEKIRADQALRASEKEKALRSEILRVFMTVSDIEAYNSILQIILKSLGCKHGVFAFFDEADTVVFPSETRNLGGEIGLAGNLHRLPQALWEDTFWMKSIKAKQSLIQNSAGALFHEHIPFENVMIVPILFHEEVIAFFELENRAGGFSETEQHWLEGTADYIAPVLNARFERDREENKRKKAEIKLRQQLQETKAIADLSRAIRSAENEDQMAAILLGETLLQVGLTDGGLFLQNEETGDLQGVLGQGWLDIQRMNELAKPGGMVHFAFQLAEIHLAPDLAADPLLPAQLKAQTPPGWQAILIPIRSFEDVLGVFMLMAPPNSALNNTQIGVLKRTIELGAKAFQRIRMHNNLRRSYEGLRSETQIRRGIEEQLAKEKEMLSISLESSGEGIIATDQNGKITIFNAAAEQITGYTAQEALGQPIEACFHLLNQQTHEAASDPIQFLLNYEQTSSLLNQPSPALITKSQEKILVSGKISPISIHQNNIEGYILIFDNVTEKEIRMAQSALSQKLEAIGQLAAGIAHEINTPIQYVGDNVNFLNRALLNFLELQVFYNRFFHAHVGETISSQDLAEYETAVQRLNIEGYTAEFPSAVEETLDGVERVRKIVLAIREFAHPSKKEKEMSDINQGIQTTITISRNEWKYCAELETDLDPDLPLVWCQIDEINQVVLNMIVNAAQAIQDQAAPNEEEKGHIWIKTRQKNGRAIISIEDTGGGIPEKIISRIFDPFFTTKGVGRGTGQGLSIAHNIIVKHHHGQIYVQSNPGIGTTFTIELPAEKELEENNYG